MQNNNVNYGSQSLVKNDEIICGSILPCRCGRTGSSDQADSALARGTDFQEQR